jgi:uncharacterized protein (DUF2344 family)
MPSTAERLKIIVEAQNRANKEIKSVQKEVDRLTSLIEKNEKQTNKSTVSLSQHFKKL